jgi:hypothetical protein
MLVILTHEFDEFEPRSSISSQDITAGSAKINLTDNPVIDSNKFKSQRTLRISVYPVFCPIPQSPACARVIASCIMHHVA